MDKINRYLYYVVLYILGGSLALYSLELFSIIAGGVTACIGIKRLKIKKKVSTFLLWILMALFVCGFSYFVTSTIQEFFYGGMFRA